MVLAEAEGSTVFPHSGQSADKALFGTGRTVRSSVSSASSTSTELFMKGVSAHSLTLGYKSAS